MMGRIMKRFRAQSEPDGVLETRDRPLNDVPNGYPRLAVFQSFEPSYSLYRGFSYLHSRLLLDMQEELTTLEKELDDLDWDDADFDPARHRSREVDVERAALVEGGRNRRVIMSEIKAKLAEYDGLLMNACAIRAFQKPSTRVYTNMRRWHYNNQPLMDLETDTIRTKDDLVTLRNGRELARFDAWVESSLESLLGRLDYWLKILFRLNRPPLVRLLQTPELRRLLGNDSEVGFYSSSRIDKVVSVLVSFIIFILLVLPLVAIYRLTHPYTDSSMVRSLCVLGSFALIFSATISIITKATRQEVFAASAGYCAILLVFISGSGT
ncbi:hypothetical protein T440DRAFT_260779 [Plenodomus tracheiphilus IPT5]|uniref:DUF6594 domain-containing protein n=1 Tax=Plenodomus tracheiphilus IPT5 TaxID=1408161 RepID=A0A6A7AR20_9PLEO|nr:hypothetical protein T440DRAFT_260779 [Plenodomus tracheiphilus IPT5]